MALYPTKVLLDKNRKPFIPFVTAESILFNNTDKSLADMLYNRYTKEEVDNIIKSLGTIQVLRGRVATYEDLLAIENPHAGDVYIVGTSETDNAEYIYIGTTWEKLGPLVDLSTLVTLDELAERLGLYATITYVDNLIKSRPIIDTSILFKYVGHVNKVSQLPLAADPDTKPNTPEDDNISDDPSVNAVTLVYSDALIEKVQEYKTTIMRIVEHFRVNDYGWNVNGIGKTILAFNVNTLDATDIQVRFINLGINETHRTIKNTYDGLKRLDIGYYATTNTYNIVDGVVKNVGNSSSITGEYVYYGSTDAENPTLRSLTVELDTWYYYLDALDDEYKTDVMSFVSRGENYGDVPLRLKNGSLYIPPTEINTYAFFKSFGAALDPRYDLEINTIYTVGPNNELYRLNEGYKWEALSTVDSNNYYTKDEVNDLFGTAEAALDVIIEGGA